MDQAKLFRELHHSEKPLIIANAWDVGSAKQLAAMGFKAVATSSAALADTQGYNDGEEIPFELLLEIVGRMRAAVDVPISVDFERGYSSNTDGILQNIERLCKIGVAGINIEDSAADGPEPLRDVAEFTTLLEAIKDFLQRKGLDLYVNVRTDAYLHKHQRSLGETITRMQYYSAAGADGVFVPFIESKYEMRAIAGAGSALLHVLSTAQLPDFPTLAAIGVKRVSTGSWLYRSLQADLRKKIETVKAEQSFRALF